MGKVRDGPASCTGRAHQHGFGMRILPGAGSIAGHRSCSGPEGPGAVTSPFPPDTDASRTRRAGSGIAECQKPFTSNMRLGAARLPLISPGSSIGRRNAAQVPPSEVFRSIGSVRSGQVRGISARRQGRSSRPLHPRLPTPAKHPPPVTLVGNPVIGIPPVRRRARNFVASFDQERNR